MGKGRPYRDYSSQRFGRWTVIGARSLRRTPAPRRWWSYGRRRPTMSSLDLASLIATFDALSPAQGWQRDFAC